MTGSDKLNENFTAAVKLLEEAKSIVIVSHINPDPDALGSIVGLKAILDSLQTKPTVTPLNTDYRTGSYQYIPGVASVVNEIPSDLSPDLIVVCDCGELHRVGEELASWIAAQNVPIINIDHHQSNPNFGKVNIIELKASSTCELVYDLYSSWGKSVFLSKEGASALLAGILGDTGGFRYRSTSADTLRKAASLADAGADLSELAQQLFGSVPMTTMKLNALAVERMRVHCDGRLAGVCLAQEDYDSVGATSEDGEDIVEILRDIEGVEVSYSLRWMDGKWKASLRTIREDVDLSAVAQEFGGGGHKAAAAFRSSKKKEEIVEKLEAKLIAALSGVANSAS